MIEKRFIIQFWSLGDPMEKTCMLHDSMMGGIPCQVRASVLVQASSFSYKATNTILSSSVPNSLSKAPPSNSALSVYEFGN